MAIEAAGFSQHQGISPDGGVVQPALVAEGLVAVPPPLFGAQAQQSPERVPPGAAPQSAAAAASMAAASMAVAHVHSTHISHDEGPRLLPSQDVGVSASSVSCGYEGLQGTRPHPSHGSPYNPSGGFLAVSYTHLTLPTILLV